MPKDPYFIEPSNIHASASTATAPNKFGVIALIGGVLLALGAVIYLFSSQSLDPAAETQRLVWKLDNVSAILDIGERYSESDEMKKFTSDSIILINGVIPPVEAAVSAAGYKKPDSGIKFEEQDAETLEELRVAGVNGTFDATYKRILLAKLRSTIYQLDTAATALNNRSFNETKESASTTLKSMYDSLDAVEV